MQVRFMKEIDIDFALNLTSSEGWTDIRSDFQSLISHQPQAAFIALEDEESIGIISAVVYGDIGFIGSLIVLQSHRNKGVGTSLMRYAINYLETNGVKMMMLDAVPEAVPIYERLGFRKCCKSLRLSGYPSDTDPLGIRKATEQDLNWIFRLDAKAFGGNRSHFLKHRYLEFPDLAYVIDNVEVPTGFIMASDRKDTVRIAPWIIANHDRYAGNLIKAVAHARMNQSLSIGLLETNSTALSILKDLGFQERFFSIRMALSTTGIPSFSDMMYSIGSPAKG